MMSDIGSWIKNAPKASRIMCIWLPELINFYGSTMAGWKNIFHRFQNPNNPTTLFRPAQVWWSYCDTYFFNLYKIFNVYQFSLDFLFAGLLWVSAGKSSFIVWRKSSSLVVYFFWLGRGRLLSKKLPSLAAFLNAAFAGGPSVLSKTRKQRSAFSNPFSAGIWVVEATSEWGLEKVEIRDYALKSAGGLSEAKPSCRLLISVFSIVPDFVVFPASWSGADASHIPALNTSSIHPLRCFRTFDSTDGSPANTDFTFDCGTVRVWYYTFS